jgi:hypothetical protein
MADAKVTIVYVQQERHPGGWVDHASTEDREIAESRYKAFARERGTRLIERTEQVLAEGTPAPAKERKSAKK